MKDPERYHLVGEAYIHGVMGGALIEALEKGLFNKKDFTLL